MNGLIDCLQNKNFKIVIVNGRQESGKTSFEEFCKIYLTPSYCVSCSTIDCIKSIAKCCGWDGTKTPENRKFLSDLKDLLTQYNDFSFNNVIDAATNFEQRLRYCGQSQNPHILFVDCREPEEIQKFKDRLGATTLLIRRPGDEEKETSNHADANVFNYQYDYIIENDSTLQELEQKARNFINLIFKENSDIIK